MKKLDDVITQADAARLRGVTPNAIADLIRRGRLTVVEIAGRKHVKRSEILAFEELPVGRPAQSHSRHKKKESGRVTPKSLAKELPKSRNK